VRLFAIVSSVGFHRRTVASTTHTVWLPLKSSWTCWLESIWSAGWTHCSIAESGAFICGI